MSKVSSLNEGAEMDIPRSRANLWFVLIWLIWIVDLMDKMAINAVLPQLKDEFLFSDAQLGLVSSIVSLAIGLLALPMAVLVDRWSRRKMIAVMVGAWSLATFLTGRATGFVSMLLARSSVGIGEAGYHPAAIALVSAWYPKKVRGLAMGFLYTAAPLGSMAGIVLAGVLAHSLGWRACFGVLAAPGALLAALAWFLPDYPSRVVEQRGGRVVKVGAWNNIGHIVRSPALIYLYFTCAAVALANLGFTAWGVTFFVRTFAMTAKEASLWMGATILIATPGAILGGWLGDRLVKRTNKGRLLATIACSVLFFIAMSASLQLAMAGMGFRVVIACWTLASFFLLGIVSNQFTAVQDLAAPQFRATAAGFVPLFQQAVGGFLGPVIVGALSDRLGLGTGLQIVAAISVTLVVLLNVMTIKFYDRGVERMRQLSDDAVRQAAPAARAAG